jgi:hypothetical protein
MENLRNVTKENLDRYIEKVITDIPEGTKEQFARKCAGYHIDRAINRLRNLRIEVTGYTYGTDRQTLFNRLRGIYESNRKTILSITALVAVYYFYKIPPFETEINHFSSSEAKLKFEDRNRNGMLESYLSVGGIDYELREENGEPILRKVSNDQNCRGKR